jgi:hypothetical protein
MRFINQSASNLIAVAAVLLGLSLSLSSPLLSHAQIGGSVSGQVIQPAPPTGTGGPAPSASVRLCTSTATGTPCSPLIPGLPSGSGVFLDPALTIGTTNPATTDQYGNYALWVNPGPILVQVTPINGITYSYLEGASNGTVTSIGLSMPSIFSVLNSPITSAGTINVGLAAQTANLVWASPNGSSGTPIFRNLVGGDFGSASAYNVLANCTGGTAAPAFCQLNANMIPSTLNPTTISGNGSVTGNFIADGFVSVAGTLTVTGATTLDSTLLVLGSTTLTDALATSTLTANGSIIGHGAINAVTGYQINGSYGTAGQILQSTGTGTTYANHQAGAAQCSDGTSTFVNANVITSQPMKTCSFAAGTLNKLGSAIRLTAGVQVLPGISTASSVSWGLGNTASIAFQFSAASQTASLNSWNLQGQLSCVVNVTGAAGGLTCVAINTAVGASSPTINGVGGFFTPVDLTNAVYVGMACQFNSASASNECIEIPAITEQVN